MAMEPVLSVILLLLGAGLGLGGGYVLRSQKVKNLEIKHKEEQEKALREAEKKAQALLEQSRQETQRNLENLQKEERAKRKKLEELESRLLKKEHLLDEKVENAEKRKEELETRLEELKKEKEKLNESLQKQEAKLQEIAALSRDDAKELLLKQVEKETEQELLAHAKKIEASIKEEVDTKAKQMLADAIQRYASETAVESTTTSVTLPADDMKGRIIGREGRNINAFETVTGVDVIVDDTPGSIIISGFDPIRRYMAKITLERLVEDGRIHPARIEETHAKVKEEVNVLIKELGEKAAFEVGVVGLPAPLLKILGRLKFRVAYGQNVLKHAMEVAFLAGELAGMMGANVEVVKKAGLLHDIGKAVDHEVQGKHAFIGRDILKKFGLPEEVVHCVEANEADTEAKTIEAKIVQVANLISVSRPGANKENLDSYIKRLTEIEKLAMDSAGVEKVFSVRGGKVLYVFIRPEEVSDLQALKLSHEIARNLEKQFPNAGPIQVEVVRELRVEAYAE